MVNGNIAHEGDHEDHRNIRPAQFRKWNDQQLPRAPNMIEWPVPQSIVAAGAMGHDESAAIDRSLQFDARPHFDDTIRRDAKELGSVGRIALHPREKAAHERL